jgi:hypothetical protein
MTMPAVLRIPGTTISGVPVPVASPLLADVAAGPLIMFEPGNPFQPLVGVPANGAHLPNLAGELAQATIGAAPGNLVAASTAHEAGSTRALIERSALGGLHMMNSQAHQDATFENFQVALPAAIEAFLAAHTDHDLYVSVWWRETRACAAGYNGVNHLAGIRKGATSWITSSGDRWLSIGSQSNNLHQTPATGTLLGRGSDRSGAVGSYLMWIGGGVAASPSTPFDPTGPLVLLGAAVAAQVNKLPSQLLYRVYVEDLTVSGRSTADVITIDQADYTAQCKTVGGRYYGDTWTDPATAVA